MSHLKETSAERFSIGRDDEIILYGYNLYCKQQADRLIESGYTVAGIIDQNADGRETYRGIEILNSVEKFSISEKSCVFIMLQNGMLHWEIVRDLYRYGVMRAVFLPMKTGFYSDDIQNEFILQYNYMMENSYSVMKVPYLRDEMFDQICRTWRPGRSLDNGEYIIWIIKDLLRTTTTEKERYRDIPIADFRPYVNLFSFLAGDKRDISEYIRLYGFAPFPEASEEALAYVIKKRKGLYEFFEEKFRSGSEGYFAAAAPKAVWNVNGYLNLCEGQHRSVYLLTKGMDYLPVRVDQTVMNHINSRRMDK